MRNFRYHLIITLLVVSLLLSGCGPVEEPVNYVPEGYDEHMPPDLEQTIKKAMEEEGIVWPQIVSVENMDATNSYGVDGIPHIILFAPDGTILKRNLRGQNMIDTVDEVMKKK